MEHYTVLIPMTIAIAITSGCYMLYHLREAWQIRKHNLQQDACANSQLVSDGIQNDPLDGNRRNKNSLFSDWESSDFVGADSHDSEPYHDLPIPEEDLAYGRLTPRLAELLPESDRRRRLQQKNLVAAGDRSRAAWVNLNARRFVWAFTLFVIAGISLLVVPMTWEPFFVAMTVVGPLLGWSVPPLLIAAQASRRRMDIECGLPDVLDMLYMGVSQGLTVLSALKRIATEVRVPHPALADELSVVNRHAEVGSLHSALQAFSERIESPQVRSLTSMLTQTTAMGSSIAQSLKEHSDWSRSTLRERADERAQSASFWLLFPVACLMVSVFLFLLTPSVVQLQDFFQRTNGDVLEVQSAAQQSLPPQTVTLALDDR